MRPFIERTPVTAQCPGGHTWETVILPGSTMPQTPSCPQCDMLVSSYPSLKLEWEVARKFRWLCLTDPHEAAALNWTCFVAFIRESYPAQSDDDIRLWLKGVPREV